MNSLQKHQVGIVIDRHNVGGVEKIAIEQVRAIQALGHDVCLVLLRRKGLVNDAFSDLTKDITMVYLDDRLPGWLRWSTKLPMFHFFSLFHLTYPFLLPWVVSKKEFPVLIFHGTSTALTGLTLRLFRGISSYAFIWDPIGYILQRVYASKLPGWVFTLLVGFGKFVDWILLHGLNGVLVGGSAHDEYFLKLKPTLFLNKIPPGVHPADKPASTKKNYVLLVTAWKAGKNPEYLLELLAADPKLHLKMVGAWLDQAYRRKFAQLIKQQGFSSRVEIVGRVTEQELSQYYAQARVVLQTNDDRGFGMPALEAAAHGTTFIIPEGQGVCELFSHGVEGFFTQEKDTQTILKYLKKTSAPAAAKKYGRTAYKKVVENYSWQRHAEQLSQLYL